MCTKVTFSKEIPFFSIDRIPANTYKNEVEIPTLGVPAQLIINNQVDDDLVYNITSMLWSSNTLNLLKTGHPKGNDVQLQFALAGMDVPLHPGAKRFYLQHGLLKE